MFGTASNEQITQIQDILGQLDHVAGAKQVDNRRRADRVSVRTLMAAILIADPAAAEVKIYSRNISRSGIGFVSRRPFKTSERIAIPFELRDHPTKLVLAQVTFCRYIRAGMYTVGAEFIESIPDNNTRGRIPNHWFLTSTTPR